MDDPPPSGFGDLLEIILRSAGGVAALAERTDVPPATLRAWRRGEFPRRRLTTQVERVEAWARAHMGAAYPPEGFPQRGLPSYISSSAPLPPWEEVDEARLDPSVPPGPHVDAADHENSQDSGKGNEEGFEGNGVRGFRSGGPLLLLIGVLVLTFGTVSVVLLWAALTPGENSMNRPGLVVTVQNKYASGPRLLAEDLTPAYLSSRPEAFCKRKGCEVPDSDLVTGDQVVAECLVKSAVVMTNADRQSPGIEINPNVAESNLWYEVTSRSGERGLISEVYLAPASRGGLGMTEC